MPTVLESLTNFLTARRAAPNGPDLIDRWNRSMETQVNVSAGNGERVDGKPSTWTDGVNEWWHIRVPKDANGEPHFNDYQIPWPLDHHAEAIGWTGWDWVSRTSRALGFDFDIITGHAPGVGITGEQLEAVKVAAQAVPWVEVRKSTGGGGLHLYVHFDGEGIPTANHTEHAALGRTVLSLLSSEAGFDFASQVDCCGGNMWIWHRKMTAANGGLSLIKAAERELTAGDLPSNWRDHVDVVTRKRTKIRIRGVEDEASVEALATSRKIVPLDAQHKKIITALASVGSAIWVPDHWLLQTHTIALAKLMEPELKAELGLKGFFSTGSRGSTDVNCFAFPLPDGAWKVYRFGNAVRETDTWERTDAHSWCYFNRQPGSGHGREGVWRSGAGQWAGVSVLAG